MKVCAQAKVVGEIEEVLAHLLVAGVVGHFGAHGEFAELGGGLAGDQAGRLVNRAARVVDVPQATHIGVGLKALEGQALLLQVAGGGQATGASANQGNAVACRGTLQSLGHQSLSRVLVVKRIRGAVAGPEWPWRPLRPRVACAAGPAGCGRARRWAAGSAPATTSPCGAAAQSARAH